MTTILLIEDEPALQNYLATELQFENYHIIQAFDGNTAWEMWEMDHAKIDLILLDWMLPGIDGLTLLKRMRRQSNVPIIFMTARDYISDKVTGLDTGADDYITKPFDIEELFARIRLVLRRQTIDNTPLPTYAEVQLNPKLHTITYHETEILLTSRESDLLAFLMENAPNPVTRDDILDAVWQDNFDTQPNAVDVYVRYLRQKITTDMPIKIETIRSVGYRLTQK